MKVFNYTALDKNEKFSKGIIDAKSLNNAKKKLEKEGYMVVNIKADKGNKMSKFDIMLTGVSRIDRILFTRHLHTMIESGIALDEAIKIASEQTANKNFQIVLTDIYKRLQQGESFHHALNQHKKHFSKFYISLVKVGEKSGKLDEVLSFLLDQQENDYDLITKARSALIYPSLIICALIVIVIFMMIFVVPKITEVLTYYDVQLPLATRVLIGLSAFIISYGIYLLPVLILLFYGFIKWKNTKQGKWSWDAFILSIPRVNVIVKEFNLARLTRALDAMIKSGISFDYAMELASEVTNNSHFSLAMTDSVKFIRKGIPLSEILQGYPELFPPITTQMIGVGEKSGKMDHMLGKLAVYYDKSVTTSIVNLSSVIEPGLLILIGFAVAFMAIAVLTPIWNYSETI